MNPPITDPKLAALWSARTHRDFLAALSLWPSPPEPTSSDVFLRHPEWWSTPRIGVSGERPFRFQPMKLIKGGELLVGLVRDLDLQAPWPIPLWDVNLFALVGQFSSSPPNFKAWLNEAPKHGYFASINELLDAGWRVD
jgi:hypothetical protein